MSRRWMVAAAIVALALDTAASVDVRAQDKEKPQAAQPAPARAQTPLRVQITLTRVKGEKKIVSQPYVLGVVTATKTSIRMGSEVPVLVAPKTGAPPSFSYRPVGTNIDCTAHESSGDGPYRLSFTISDSSVLFDPSQPQASSAGIVPDVPAFRSFHASFDMLLRDGQTTQYTSATDPVTGEVMRIEVTLGLMK